MPTLLDQETPENDAAPVAAAKAVEKRIKGTDLGEEFELCRSYISWQLDLKNLETLPQELAGTLPAPASDMLRVDIVAHTTEQEIVGGTRNSVRTRVPVDILVRKRMQSFQQESATGQIQVEEVDKLMKVPEKLWLKFYQVASFQQFDSLKYDSDNPPRILVSPDLRILRVARQFFALVRVYLIASLTFQEEA